MQLIIFNILRKVAIFLLPLIIDWIWKNKILKKNKSPKNIDKKTVIDGRILR